MKGHRVLVRSNQFTHSFKHARKHVLLQLLDRCQWQRWGSGSEATKRFRVGTGVTPDSPHRPGREELIRFVSSPPEAGKLATAARRERMTVAARAGQCTDRFAIRDRVVDAGRALKVSPVFRCHETRPQRPPGQLQRPRRRARDHP